MVTPASLQSVQVRFAVPFFDVYDPRFSDFSVPVAVRGTISFGIKDYREFVKLHRLFSFNLDDFQKQIRDAASRYIKDAVANAPAEIRSCADCVCFSNNDDGVAKWIEENLLI